MLYPSETMTGTSRQGSFLLPFHAHSQYSVSRTPRETMLIPMSPVSFQY